MGLEDIASKIDVTLSAADDVVEEREALFLERDANKMAHHIVAYVLERANDGHDPYDMGATMAQGAVIGEDESGGQLAAPVVEFLESLLSGAESVIAERYGSEPTYLDPVAHAVQYMCAHNSWPESASLAVISKARAAMAAGLRGSGKGASYGTFL